MVGTKVFFFFYNEKAYCLLKYVFVPPKDWNCSRDFFPAEKNLPVMIV